MRILLDECVNPRVQHAFPNHKVASVAKTIWRGLPDAKLISQIHGHCDVFVTIDKGFEHEHNLKTLSFGLLIVHVARNRMEHYRPLFKALVKAVEEVKPGEVVHVPARHTRKVK